MIVVDTNILVYLWIPGPFSSVVETAFQKDPEWVSPLLWRSEFRNVLANYIRRGHVELSHAQKVMTKAESLMKGKEYTVDSHRVLELSVISKCSAYDCEFVALAEDLKIPLLTTDKEILSKFKKIAISAERF